MSVAVEKSSEKKLGWIWRCSSKGSKKKGSKSCRKIVNPSIGTFFDSTSCRIFFREVLAIIICFVIEMKISDVYESLLSWRQSNDDSQISWHTIVDYFSYCREIAEVISSHTDVVIGGEGKTVQIDETFLTKRKYNRGRITEQMTITVLGLHCKEDKSCLFFKVNAKSKKELWPYIQNYVDHNTFKLCRDSAKQYQGIEQMFSSSIVHLQTNHSKGEFVNKSDKTNTINDLENQNKLLKKSIKCRRTPKLLHQYMSLYWYRKNVLNKFGDKGFRIMQFLLDIKKVYPGTVDGELKDGLTLEEIDPPTLQPEVEALLPPVKRPRWKLM